MAALEIRILSEILRTGEMGAAIRTGLTEDHFKDPESKAIFRHLHQRWFSSDAYKTLPSLESVQKCWPSFQLAAKEIPRNPSEDPGHAALTSLIKDLKMSSFDSDVRQMASYFQELVDQNPQDAADHMMKHLSELMASQRTMEKLGVRDVIERAVARYDSALTGTSLGIPWPWKCLTDDTLGKNPGDLIVFYARMKQMKCVCAGQKIMMSDGSLMPIEDIPEHTKVPSYTEQSKKMRFAKAHRVTSGTKNCVEVTTESGLRLRTSTEHLYMVPGGYQRIKNLRPGDYVATARKLPQWNLEGEQISKQDAHFLGLLVGDGNYTRAEVQFTTADRDILQSLHSHLDRHNAIIHNSGKPIEFRIVGKKRKQNNVLDLLRQLKIHGQRCNNKTIPALLFNSSQESIAAFLAGFLDTDGCVAEDHVYWSSTSRTLLEECQHLLMRFGIRGRIRKSITNFGTDAYSLLVYSNEQLSILWNYLSPYLCLNRKKKDFQKLAKLQEGKKRNVDAIPYTPTLQKLILNEKGESEWPRTGSSYYDRSKLFGSKKRISRQWLNTIAKKFESSSLKQEANSDIIWEQIKTIESIGRQPCYDICIEDGKDPNFVVEGFIVHNTWVMLYCAVYDLMVNNCRVLIWSREMSKDKMAMRLAALIAKVDYQLFKRGKLPPKMWEKACTAWEYLLAEDFTNPDIKASSNNHQLILMCGRDAPIDLEVVRAQANFLVPDVIYLDSFYHMKTKRMEGIHQRWHQMAILAEDVKTWAEDDHVPIVAVHQANRLGEKTHGDTMADMADTDVLAREADLVIRIMKRRGKELYEEDYEVETARAKQEATRIIAESPRAGRPRIQIGKRPLPPKVEEEAKTVEEQEKLEKENPDDLEEPRLGTELALVLGGNREGVLNAFTINAVPGYNFEFISSDYSLKEIEEWVGEDDEEKPKAAFKQPGIKKPDFSGETFKNFRKPEVKGRK